MVGPLHGLPISLKDQIPIKGLETVMGRLAYPVCQGPLLIYRPLGYAAWIGKYAEDDAVLVKLLLQAGAVLYVRTNVPQTLMVSLLITSLGVDAETVEVGGDPQQCLRTNVEPIQP